MRAIFAFALFTLLQIMPAPAQAQWREFRSDPDGFSVQVPQTPVITASRIENSNATQTMFLIDGNTIAYLVSVIELPKGQGPKNPDNAYFLNLLNRYVEGSKTTMRTNRAATISGQPGIEGVSDTGNSVHFTQVTTKGDRIYMVVYVGTKGSENGADAKRYRDSFKILK